MGEYGRIGTASRRRSNRTDKAVEPTRSQNITVSCRRSASAVAFAGDAAGTSSAARPAPADRFQQQPAMADRGYAQFFQIVDRQLRQDAQVDLVLAESLLVPLQSEPPQPAPNVHRVVPALAFGA